MPPDPSQHPPSQHPPAPPHLPRRANYYESGPLDRMTHLRADIETLLETIADGAARIVPVWQAQNLVSRSNSADAPPDPVMLRGDHPILPQAEHLVFLGMVEETAHFAADFSHLSAPPLEEAGEFRDLRAFGQIIPHGTGSILAYARGLMHWHRRHLFCGVCGSPTVSDRAGHVRRCTNPDCGAQHFPRTDPAVIMLVHDGADRVILGRQLNWPPGMHSVLAGFVEPGESMEDAVAREVFEEVGARVKNVRYHSSQPWPFPASLMIGFTAEAEVGPITLDETEIESARWYSRDEVLASPEDLTFRLPRKDSIARRLLEDWLGDAAADLKPQSPNLPFPKPKVL
ncbi:MAG: NAD(+) diphosphatase [Alphaproteobacteria bacterium]|nr:NAD(+) diphosphatase [Alphaproteobacteria bacterium]